MKRSCAKDVPLLNYSPTSIAALWIRDPHELSLAGLVPRLDVDRNTKMVSTVSGISEKRQVVGLRVMPQDGWREGFQGDRQFTPG